MGSSTRLAKVIYRQILWKDLSIPDQTKGQSFRVSLRVDVIGQSFRVSIRVDVIGQSFRVSLRVDVMEQSFRVCVRVDVIGQSFRVHVMEQSFRVSLRVDVIVWTHVWLGNLIPLNYTTLVRLKFYHSSSHKILNIYRVCQPNCPGGFCLKEAF